MEIGIGHVIAVLLLGYALGVLSPFFYGIGNRLAKWIKELEIKR